MAFPLLPVNPLLAPPVTSVPSLNLPLGAPQVEQIQTTSPMVIVAEGMPPIQTKLIEKMRRWEYVDLSKLLGDSDPILDEASVVIEGQQLRMEVPQRNQRRQIKDILTWLEAYSRFMAVLLSAHDTSKEEAAGLAAHMHLILQLTRDLGSPQSLKYDQNFREWAAAKGVKKWDELNMAIYGRSLSLQHSSGRGKYLSQQVGGKRPAGACFKWNAGHCNHHATSGTYAPCVEDLM